jgi:hypothetical protein
MRLVSDSLCPEGVAAIYEDAHGALYYQDAGTGQLYRLKAKRVEDIEEYDAPENNIPTE